MAITQVTRRISQVEPIGPNTDMCRITLHLLGNQFTIAESILNKALKNYPKEAALYGIKADFLTEKQDYLAAVAYIQKMQQLWPAWVKNPMCKRRM